MKDKWIGPWECLLLGERLDAEFLGTFSKKLSNSLNSQCDVILNDNLIKVILSGALSVLAAEACIVQSLFYKEFFGRGGCCVEQRFRAFADHSKRVKSVLTSVESLISEAVGEGMKVNRQPIILVLDSDVQRGCYAHQGAPLHYLFAGSPAIIANLWSVAVTEITLFAKAILNSWTPSFISVTNASVWQKILMAENPTFHPE